MQLDRDLTVTFGSRYPRLCTEVRQAFPALTGSCPRAEARAGEVRFAAQKRRTAFAGYFQGMNGRSWAVAGVVLGIGAGGFVDGIVAHQLLDWHHMLSGWYPPDDMANMRVNMIGDGLFHLFSLLVVLVGIGLLAAAAPVAPPARGRRLVGWMITGWGVFNVVEGLVDHLVLGVHHVRHGPDQLAYDLGFLALGVVLVLAGTWLARSAPDHTPAPVRAGGSDRPR